LYVLKCWRTQYSYTSRRSRLQSRFTSSSCCRWSISPKRRV